MGKTQHPALRSDKEARPSQADQEQARQLLEEAGSKELARQVIDSSDGHPAQATPENDAFARRWGFGSYLEMFEASKPTAKGDGKDWLVTNIGADRWIVWNDEDLRADRVYTSPQEAAQHAGRTEASDAQRRPPPTG